MKQLRLVMDFFRREGINRLKERRAAPKVCYKRRWKERRRDRIFDLFQHGRESYDALLTAYGLPTISSVLREYKERIGTEKIKINILDAGAGAGFFGRDLINHYSKGMHSIEVEYAGIDLNERKKRIDLISGVKHILKHRNLPEEKVLVRKHDFESQHLPENKYDVIVAGLSFPYIKDKFKALENLINSVKPKGTPLVPGIEDFFFEDQEINDERIKFNYLKQILEKKNPNLYVGVHEKKHGMERFFGLKITKSDSRKVSIPLELVEWKERPLFGGLVQPEIESTYCLK
ncbi:MAG: class I SAM-dependent methyltransferase [Candidatus Diapherotrites archaeon]